VQECVCGIVVELLLERRSILDAKNWKGATPLCVASSGRHPEVVKVALELPRVRVCPCQRFIDSLDWWRHFEQTLLRAGAVTDSKTSQLYPALNIAYEVQRRLKDDKMLLAVVEHLLSVRTVCVSRWNASIS